MRLDLRTRREEEEFLQSHKNVQEQKNKEERTTKEERADAIKTMLRGLLFGVMFLCFDIGYRKYLYTGSKLELFFYIATMVTMLATLQIPIGLYRLIKTLWADEVPLNKRGR